MLAPNLSTHKCGIVLQPTGLLEFLKVVTTDITGSIKELLTFCSCRFRSLKYVDSATWSNKRVKFLSQELSHSLYKVICEIQSIIIDLKIFYLK